MKKRNKIFCLVLAGVMLVACGGCVNDKKDNYKPLEGLDTNTEVVIKIATVYELDKAAVNVINEFIKRYPNVKVQLDYVENYNTNSVRMIQKNEADIIYSHDMEYSTYTITDESTGESEKKTSDDFFYNFAHDEEIDFSNTTDKLMNNYRHVRQYGEEDITYMYSVPVGGEVRGLYVNTTLLNSLGLSVPTDWNEFIECCRVLKENGYIPIQGNAGSAGISLGLASAVNEVTHDEAKLDKFRNAEADSSLLFRSTFEKIHYLAVNRYYDYKYVEEQLNEFKVSSDIGQTRSFLGLKLQPDYTYSKPQNNFGTVAFFPYLSYLCPIIDKLIDDYKLDTEYTFINTPLSDTKDSPVYMTPYYGISVNKQSKNLLWCREFVNFLFNEKINKLYAETANILPNSLDVTEYMANKYGVSQDACASCGEIYFSDRYNGYTPLANSLVDDSKCCAQKYMVKLVKDDAGNIVYNKDEDGRKFLYTDNGTSTKVYKEYIGEEDASKPGFAFCTTEYFLDKLESSIAKYRE